MLFFPPYSSPPRLFSCPPSFIMFSSSFFFFSSFHPHLLLPFLPCILLSSFFFLLLLLLHLIFFLHFLLFIFIFPHVHFFSTSFFSSSRGLFLFSSFPNCICCLLYPFSPPPSLILFPFFFLCLLPSLPPELSSCLCQSSLPSLCH